MIVDEVKLRASQDAAQRTPLHLAAVRGHAAAVRVLLRVGADRSARDAAGNTAAELAASYEVAAVFARIMSLEEAGITTFVIK